MGKSENIPDETGSEILRQMREDTGSKKHLDQLKLKAQAALRRAVDARDEQAFAAALIALGIDPESESGRAHLRGFRQLPAKCF
jgi:NAD(P)H-nitrite reductase large subunit